MADTNDKTLPLSNDDVSTDEDATQCTTDETVEGDDDEIDRREAIRALTKYSAAGGAAVVVLSSKGALSMTFLSEECSVPSPPPFCP
ncbi:MAG: hypothetical protein P8P30_06750 [Rickettsiales bacterium]|nr:hypothetical protein [Rickettsiales bacterium]